MNQKQKQNKMKKFPLAINNNLGFNNNKFKKEKKFFENQSTNQCHLEWEKNFNLISFVCLFEKLKCKRVICVCVCV